VRDGRWRCERLWGSGSWRCGNDVRDAMRCDARGGRGKQTPLSRQREWAPLPRDSRKHALAAFKVDAVSCSRRPDASEVAGRYCELWRHKAVVLVQSRTVRVFCSPCAMRSLKSAEGMLGGLARRMFAASPCCRRWIRCADVAVVVLRRRRPPSSPSSSLVASLLSRCRRQCRVCRHNAHAPLASLPL
jgi:hypothetical protein